MTNPNATSRPSIADKRRIFAALQASGCFVIPNPWDAGSARYLESIGFKALVSTSSGFAWTQARADNAISRDLALEHLHALVESVDLPVNADFESGFGKSPADVAESVGLAVDAGVAGLSIEDNCWRMRAALMALLKLRLARILMRFLRLQN
jgi:2-methylisocitrate lyase-like PEP mutase family enzyme